MQSIQIEDFGFKISDFGLLFEFIFELCITTKIIDIRLFIVEVDLFGIVPTIQFNL